jgi:hypothetical protein
MIQIKLNEKIQTLTLILRLEFGNNNLQEIQWSGKSQTYNSYIREMVLIQTMVYQKKDGARRNRTVSKLTEKYHRDPLR